jgi:hypothetical protein
VLKLPFNALFLGSLWVLSWSTANASFCTTYVGTGDCVNLTGNSTTPVPISASAVFQVGAGNTLDITLINDAGSSATQLGGADTLTAVLFNLSSAGGSLTNTGGTASFTSPLIGTATLNGPSGGFTIGQEWALATGISAFGFSNLYSVTGTGLNGPPGGKGNLCGSAGCGDVLDGPSWGISPASNAGGFAPGILPLVNNFAYFTLPGLTAGLTNAQLKADLSDIVFQYGTNSGDATGLSCTTCGSSSPTPEPSQVVFLLVSSAMIGFIAWRRRQIVA